MAIINSYHFETGLALNTHKRYQPNKAATCIASILFAFTVQSTYANNCETFGENITQAKTEHPPAAPGSYAKRKDVQAFAQQVSTCYQVDPQWVENTLTKAKYQTSSAKFIIPKPAGKRNWRKFKAPFLQADRVQAGILFWKVNTHLLAQAEQVYGVEPEAIIGILGVETIYGRYTGDFRIIDALSTLAFDFPAAAKRNRTDFFAKELAQYLAFCYKNGVDPLSIKGSYAGAMGMPQFMPSSLLTYGVDFDGDGHIDLHNSNADIIGSVANYLAQHGWQKGLPAVLPVNVDKISNNNLKILLEPDITPTFTLQQMADHGAQVDLGEYANTFVESSLFSLINLENSDDGTTDYIAGTQNFYVITRYNRSSFYAATVEELGQSVKKHFKNRAHRSKWRPGEK